MNILQRIRRPVGRDDPENKPDGGPGAILRFGPGAWKRAVLVSALAAIVSLPAWHFLTARHPVGRTAMVPEPGFAGSAACRDCHDREYGEWQGSHHDLAMDVASEDSVLGDFENAEFSLHGVTSRFYRKDGRFFVHTNGPGGRMGDFEITHTFGWFPLQQYLVPFPGGRLQTLPIAWDSRRGRWFRVPPEGPLEPSDWLYWTNAAQNWNGMCAQCHTTGLEKNYDPATDSYATAWSGIDVGCEACHGPASRHLDWARTPETDRRGIANFGLARKTTGLGPAELVGLCAPCHSRRSPLGDDPHTGTALLDHYLPSTLSEGLYFADGQILDEVYVYGSFTQSKMYGQGVSCRDCHEVHSARLLRQGNALCLRCHPGARYDTPSHHFHKPAGEAGEPIRSATGEVLFAVGSGAACVQCHMPGRYYMGVDYRPDHGFRVPDPELSAAVGSPDACLRCHAGRDPQWSIATVRQWYGKTRPPHYGTIIARARARDPGAGDDLAGLAASALYPAIVRATALSLLAAYPPATGAAAMEAALTDADAVLRATAARSVQVDDPRKLARLLAPLLSDPARAVRTEAAGRLAGAPLASLDEAQRGLFQAVLREFESTLLYSADFASARHNLGNLYTALQRPDEALEQYQQAIRIDDRFFPSKVNLAAAYNRRGDNGEAERLLREVLAQEPDLHEVSYSLGLLLVEMGRESTALGYLQSAARGLPGRARIRYNLGLLQARLRDLPTAEKELQAALLLEPGNPDFQFALADHYLRTGQFDRARPLVDSLKSARPGDPAVGRMTDFIREQSGK